MIKILDRYILGKFLSTFLFVVITLVAIICIIDFTENNEDFIDGGISFHEIIFSYYLNYIPYLANFLSPITVFIATILVTARLASHTEIIAILGSGVSFKRILATYAVGAMFLGVIIFWLIGWVIPKANEERIAFELKYFESDSKFDRENYHLRVTPNTYVYFANYSHETKTGFGFALETLEDNQLVYKIKCDRIQWDSLKNVWHLDYHSVRAFKNGKESLQYRQTLDTTFNLHPNDFTNIFKRNETLTLSEIDAYIETQKLRGAENVDVFLIEKYERLTYPFAIVILTLIGVIVSARKSREGIGFQITLGFVLAFLYIIILLAGRTFSQTQGLHPMISAWLPNIIFSAIGVVLYKTVPR